MRLQRLGGNQQKDLQATRQLAEFHARLRERAGNAWPVPAEPSLAGYRWLLEEYRVSLFAQALGTRVPVSARRLAAYWSSEVERT
jgi:ATP-dependent helicase HrpA